VKKLCLIHLWPSTEAGRQGKLKALDLHFHPPDKVGREA
jgi:hypothetical protein